MVSKHYRNKTAFQINNIKVISFKFTNILFLKKNSFNTSSMWQSAVTRITATQ